MDGLLIETLKALADRDRLRIAGRLAERPAGLEALVAATGLPAREVVRHLGHLERAGLIEQRRARGRATVPGAVPPSEYALRVEALTEVGRRIGALEPPPLVGATAPGPDGRPWPAEDAKVLRAFVVDGRLVSIPAQERKREVILRWVLDAAFPEERVYLEKEANMRLALLHPDVASLRRYLVDGGLMTRSGGEYRRLVAPVGAQPERDPLPRGE